MPRPKTRNAFETLNCRVPPGMVARIRDYATLHERIVRDVVAQFIETGLSGTPVAPLEQEAEQIVRVAKHHITEAMKLLNSVPSSRRAAVVPPSRDPGGYDTTKYYLGKLCPRGHEYYATGQTLKTIKGNKCLECENARRREKRQAA